MDNRNVLWLNHAVVPARRQDAKEDFIFDSQSFDISYEVNTPREKLNLPPPLASPTVKSPQFVRRPSSPKAPPQKVRYTRDKQAEQQAQEIIKRWGKRLSEQEAESKRIEESKKFKAAADFDEDDESDTAIIAVQQDIQGNCELQKDELCWGKPSSSVTPDVVATTSASVTSKTSNNQQEVAFSADISEIDEAIMNEVMDLHEAQVKLAEDEKKIAEIKEEPSSSSKLITQKISTPAIRPHTSTQGQVASKPFNGCTNVRGAKKKKPIIKMDSSQAPYATKQLEKSVLYSNLRLGIQGSTLPEATSAASMSEEQRRRSEEKRKEALEKRMKREESTQDSEGTSTDKEKQQSAPLSGEMAQIIETNRLKALERRKLRKEQQQHNTSISSIELKRIEENRRRALEKKHKREQHQQQLNASSPAASATISKPVPEFDPFKRKPVVPGTSGCRVDPSPPTSFTKLPGKTERSVTRSSQGQLGACRAQMEANEAKRKKIKEKKVTGRGSVASCLPTASNLFYLRRSNVFPRALCCHLAKPLTFQKLLLHQNLS